MSFVNVGYFSCDGIVIYVIFYGKNKWYYKGYG